MKIITSNLGKRFNREWIVRNFTFELEHRKTYAIVGPNGSGKSTLLQILWGQMPASEGTIQYSDDKGLIPLAEVYQSISIATPYMDLIDEFTLQEMAAFHFSFKLIRDKKTIEEVIEKMGLAHAKQKLISNFSSGMRQRLKLGLAFYTQSEALFLDEPTTNLDNKAIDWYWQNLTPLLDNSLVIIASNIEAEYPSAAEKIDIQKIKGGYNTL
jgi:ABC-type multidrug transport system ATPase subunit